MKTNHSEFRVPKHTPGIFVRGGMCLPVTPAKHHILWRVKELRTEKTHFPNRANLLLKNPGSVSGSLCTLHWHQISGTCASIAPIIYNVATQELCKVVTMFQFSNYKLLTSRACTGQNILPGHYNCFAHHQKDSCWVENSFYCMNCVRCFVFIAFLVFFLVLVIGVCADTFVIY